MIGIETARETRYGSTTTGGALERCQLSRVEPDQIAFATGIDDRVAGTVVGMDVHPRVAFRTIDLAFQRSRFDRVWSRVSARVIRASLLDDFPEIVRLYQDPATSLAEFPFTVANDRLHQCLPADWTVVSRVLAQRNHAFIQPARRQRLKRPAKPAFQTRPATGGGQRSGAVSTVDCAGAHQMTHVRFSESIPQR